MKRVLIKAPAPFDSWQAYWYDALEQGKPIEELTRPGYSVHDVRHLTREYALRRQLPLLPVLERIRKKE